VLLPNSARAVGRVSLKECAVPDSSPRVWKHMGPRSKGFSRGSYARQSCSMIGRPRRISHCRKASATGARGGRSPRFACCHVVRGVGTWPGLLRQVTLAESAGAIPDGRSWRRWTARWGQNRRKSSGRKNLVGAFYPAKLVIADRSSWHAPAAGVSLRHLRNHQVWRDRPDAKFFQFLELKMEKVFGGDPAALDSSSNAQFSEGASRFFG